MASLNVDLHQLSRITNGLLVALFVAFLGAGIYLTFWFHFLTVFFFMLTVANFFYRFVQTRHTVLRNFGILGQARYLLESVGPELRQYLYASDTEERPFNRDERSEIYRKAKQIDSALSFGTHMEYGADEIKIRHSMFPTHKENLEPFRLTFGDERGLDTAYTITKPVMVSAMSFGALGEAAVRAIARGSKVAGIPMNTGEGGFPKYHLMEGCDLIFQIGTAKFGVRHEDGTFDPAKLAALTARPQVKMVEIKFSQGAKPGKGGLLPKEKITPEIAALRGVPMGEDVVSPPYHAECHDNTSTVRFIREVQEIAGVPVGIKTCVGSLDEIRALFTEMQHQDVFPDYVSIDGGEGGTGAAPKPYMDSVGMPLLPALAGVQQIAVELGVRDRFKLVGAGKLVNAAKQLGGLALGADAIYTARGFMLALGCIQAFHCGDNTCPVGITTHDKRLQRGLVVERKSLRVAAYVAALEHDFENLLCSVGVKNAGELTSRILYIPPASILAGEVKL